MPLVVAAALVVSVLFAVPAASAPGTASVPSRVRVPVDIVRAPDSRGLNGVVQITLGSRPPIRVMLDTGSVGLRVFPGGWDGAVSDGFASAPLTIGGIRSSGPVRFQVAASSNAYLDQWAEQDVVGILGIGMGGSPVVNPLTLLPGDLGRRWSVHFVRDVGGSGRDGVLQLGATVPADALATFRVPSEGTSSTGVPLWADHRAPACWSFDEARPVCADTWFDSGFHVLRVAGRAFADVPGAPATGLVAPGTVVRMGAVGAAFTSWKVAAGGAASRNAVEVFSTRGEPSVNTGNAVFFDRTVTYDLNRGLVALS